MPDENLFEKAAVFADIHYGCRSNSELFNKDCDRFIKWFIDESKERNAETCIFLGDWNHSRSAVNVRTMNHSTHGIRKLAQAFEKVYMIVGNHDLFFREKRDLTSIPHAKWLDNVHIVDEGILEKGNCALVPWLVDEEWKKVKRVKKAKYVFGHFELPHFKMNEMVTMPDHGLLNEDDFNDSEMVFSGHFHARQNRKNVWYVGSPFAHNYADAWDFERGCMFLEWGKEPEFADWDDGPIFITLKLSELKKQMEVLNDRVHCKAFIDIDFSYEDAAKLKDECRERYNPRELSFIPQKSSVDDMAELFEDGLNVESVDEIVMSQLKNFEDGDLSGKRLMEIYRDL